MEKNQPKTTLELIFYVYTIYYCDLETIRISVVEASQELNANPVIRPSAELSASFIRRAGPEFKASQA
jgi:hypothetical protein